jgi:hypothetical protein
MDIILKEKEMAEMSLETGYIDYKKPTETIKILIKYLYSKGMDKTQIRDEIETFMKKYYVDFNSASWQTMLDNMVKTYSKEKFNLIDIDSVSITQNEWNKILSINNIKLEKLLFILLVYAKVLNKINSENNSWVNKECNVLFKTAKLTETGKQQRLILKQLGDLEYIQIPKMVDGTSVRVNFIDDTSEVLFELTDFNNIILGYLKLKGENIGNCEECGSMIKIVNNKKKYCDECAKNIKNEQNKKYYYLGK